MHYTCHNVMAHSCLSSHVVQLLELYGIVRSIMRTCMAQVNRPQVTCQASEAVT